jgi:hypothetical protein
VAFAGLQAYLPQEVIVVGGRQVPFPSQLRGPTEVLPLQVLPAQGVPETHLRQAPEPSQLPSWPQLARVEAAHWLSGSMPAGTAAQVPVLPGRLQAKQVPVHAEAQHTPCSQWLDWQSPVVWQGWPSARLPHMPPVHGTPVVQVIIDAEQLVAQAVALAQSYG